MSGPHLIPFPSELRREYHDLCEWHASLMTCIEREGPKLRASRLPDALAELERLAGAMLDQISELHTRGTAEGWL